MPVLAATVASTVLKSELLQEKLKLVLGASDGVKRLRDELIWMVSFIEDADNMKSNSSKLSDTRLSQIRDLAYEAEDLIDTFDLKLGRETDTSKWWDCISFIKNIFTAYTLGRQVEKLDKKANDISSWRVKYDLNNTYEIRNQRNSVEILKELREINSYTDNEFIIGLEEDASTLRAKLKNGDSKLSVISILGMGGLGKTTLARKLYKELKDEYPCHSWICVSQEFKIEEIFRQLIKSFKIPVPSGYKEMTLPDLLEKLHIGLTGNKFLIVLDDVWTKEAWLNITRVLPNEDTHSRIIVTTRMDEVAKVTNGFTLNQAKLDKYDSWNLFCRKAFPSDTNMKDPVYGEDILSLGREMVEKCDGLPLAIVTLGALLRTKLTTIDEWKAVKDDLWREIEKTELEIDAILSLSINYLPDHLKLCLLYVGMYPEDYEISVLKLMRLWEAEGFIGSNGKAKVEHIAKSCFNELVGRSLLHKTTEDWIDGSSCRVHDLVRDLVIKKAEEISYAEFYGENKTSDFKKTQNQRRLALHNHDLRKNKADYTNKSLRTLHLFWWDKEESSYLSSLKKLLNSLYPRFPLLRVLDINILGEMPNLQIDKLTNLRYLALACTEPIKLPETLGDLKQLQTLSVWTTGLANVKLPKTVVKLLKLKHLRGNFKQGAARWIGELEGLESLEISHFRNWTDLDTVKLGNLRHLSLFFTAGNYTSKSSTSTVFFSEKFKNLQRLQKFRLFQDIPYNISEILKLCREISHVYLPTSFPNDLVFHEFGLNLQVVEFRQLPDNCFSNLMSSLKILPKLRALRFEIRTWHHLRYTCSQEGFSQLQTLDVSFNMRDRHNGTITLMGDMPRLTNLISRPPNQLKWLKRPQQLTIE